MGRDHDQQQHEERRCVQIKSERLDTQPDFLAVGTLEMEPLPGCDIDDEKEAALDIDRELVRTDVVEIVHDLKNPLATIALEMCLLADKLGDDTASEIKSVLSRVTQNVTFLDRMVQDILDSCSIEAGCLQLNTRQTELRTLLEQCIERSVATRDRPRVFLEAGPRVTIAIDDLRIERVVANLLQNALKYAPATSGIVVRLQVGHEMAKVSVIDAGPGMTTEEMKCVFEKYGRTARTRGLEGSGLGLYVSKRIVEAHGGKIGVESIRNIGSRFFFELPLT